MSQLTYLKMLFKNSIIHHIHYPYIIYITNRNIKQIVRSGNIEIEQDVDKNMISFLSKYFR